MDAKLNGGPYHGTVVPVRPEDLDTGITITVYPIRHGKRAHTPKIDRYRYRPNSLDLVAKQATMDWEPNTYDGYPRLP